MTSIIENVSLRGALGKWLGKRGQRRHQRLLEDYLRHMDARTLSDIGFNALLEEANSPESRTDSAVIATLKKMTSRSS